MNSAHSEGAGASTHGFHWMVLFADWRCRRFGCAWATVTANITLESIVNMLVHIAVTVIVELALAVVSGRGVKG